MLRAVAVLLVIAVPGASASWPMFQHDRQHTGRASLLGAPKPGVKWTFDTTLTPGTPVVGPDGTIYVPAGMRDDEAGSLHAVDPVDGIEDWAFPLPGAPVSTPAVGTDGTIYVHTYAEGNIASIEHLVAVNPNGTEKWDVTPFNLGAAVLTSFNQSSPVIAKNGTIWVGSKDGALYKLRPGDGSVACAVLSTEDIQSAPAIAPDGTAYAVATDSTLSAYEPDCDPKWDFPLSNGITANPQSPTVGPDGTIWVGDRDERLVGVNPNGTEKCRFTTGHDIDSTPAIGPGGTVYVGSDGLYAVDPADCSQKWKFADPLFSSASPIVDRAGTIFWRESFTAYAVNPNGTEKWSTSVAPPTGALLHPSGVIGASGTLYLADGGFSSSPRRLRALADTTPSVSLSLAGQDALDPRVAVDADGDAVFAWRRFDGSKWRIQTRARSAGGALTPVQTLSSSGQDAFDPQVAVDDDGDAVFTWRRFDGTNFRVQARARSGGGVLSSVQTLSAAGQDAFDPQVGADADGDAVFAWRRFDASNPPFCCDRIQARARSAAGVLSSVQDVSGDYDALDPHVALDAGGDAVFTWARLFGGVDARARSAAGTLSSAQVLSAVGEDPQVGVDAGGNAVFTWRRSDNDNIQTRVRSAAGALSPVQTLFGNPGIGPQLGVDADGDAVFTWQRLGAGIDARARSVGGALSSAQILSAAGQNPQVGVDADGDAVFAWLGSFEGFNNRIQTRGRSAAGLLTPVQALSDPDRAALEPQVAVAADGDAVFAWRLFDGSNWRVQTRVGP